MFVTFSNQPMVLSHLLVKVFATAYRPLRSFCILSHLSSAESHCSPKQTRSLPQHWGLGWNVRRQRIAAHESQSCSDHALRLTRSRGPDHIKTSASENRVV